MKTFLVLILFSQYLTSSAQNSYVEILEKFNTNEIPYITVSELTTLEREPILLDAREKKEYEVSHLRNALHVGFLTFNPKKVRNINKDKMIVVYCSLGVRSEKIAIKLRKRGFTNVFNLHGGIFNWINEDFPVYNNQNISTKKVHTFSKEWSKYVIKGIKVY